MSSKIPTTMKAKEGLSGLITADTLRKKAVYITDVHRFFQFVYMYSLMQKLQMAKLANKF